MAALRLGIVGVGRHGSRYARHAARDVDGIELVAICRRNAQAGRELAAELGCAYEPDPAALCTRDDIDAVALVTVPSILENLVVLSAGAGKRLLVEKPVALDAASGGRILDVLESSGVYCLAGHTLRFNRAVNGVRERIGELGRIDSVVLTQRFAPQSHIDWIDEPTRSGGGNILHTGVHGFDLIRYMTGLEPESVVCSTASVHTRRTEDNFSCMLSFRDSEALGMVTCSRSTHGRNGLIEISGENGQLVGDHVHNLLARIGPDGRTEIGLPDAAQTVRDTLEALVADAGSGSAPRASYRDGLVAVNVADACYRSAASGQRERVVLPRPATLV